MPNAPASEHTNEEFRVSLLQALRQDFGAGLEVNYLKRD